MNLQKYRSLKLPAAPGVYEFVGRGGKLLYIGRATSLKNRVRSYFDPHTAYERGGHIAAMVEEARTVRVIPTQSVLEAIIIEAQLIRTHHPPFNTKEKDDKSFNVIVVTDEDYPRVLLVRGRELSAGSFRGKVLHVFGPFPRGGVLKDAMKIIRKIFPFRDTCTPGTGKPCFNRQIGLCPGVCTGEISKREYRSRISNLVLFLSGKRKALLVRLTREMKRYARERRFEKAGEIKQTLFRLQHIQDVALIREETYRSRNRGLRVEGYDIAHTGGTYPIGVMTAVIDGETVPSEYRTFRIKSFKGIDDTRALKEVVARRMGHPEWDYPKLIVVDGGRAQKNAAETILRVLGAAIPVASVLKDEHHRPKQILGEKQLVQERERDILRANSEAHRFALKRHRIARGKIR